MDILYCFKQWKICDSLKVDEYKINNGSWFSSSVCYPGLKIIILISNENIKILTVVIKKLSFISFI